MNDEIARRIAAAVEAVLEAADALAEARAAVGDPRFESSHERERSAAVKRASHTLDTASRRIEQGLRRAAVAASLRERHSVYTRYSEAMAALFVGRESARSAPSGDGTPERRSRLQDALARLEAAQRTAASFAFGD
jgi:hypothetical protein